MKIDNICGYESIIITENSDETAKVEIHVNKTQTLEKTFKVKTDDKGRFINFENVRIYLGD